METDGREQTDQRRTDDRRTVHLDLRRPPPTTDSIHPATAVIGCNGSGISGMDKVIEMGHAMDIDSYCISLDYVAPAWPRDIISLCSIDAADNSKLNGIGI